MAAAKTALVLSGGGSLGAVQVGMLHALSRSGVAPDMLIGASVGALNAAWFADDPSPDGVNRLARLWCALHRRDVFPLTLWAGLKALLLGQDHLVEPGALLAIIRRSLRMTRIEDARIPLHITTTDVLSGQEILLSAGSIEKALIASTAIPVVFPHVRADGRYLVDGGVGSNTPIASAVALGAERIVVLPTGMSCAMREPPQNMAALALHVMSLQNMRQIDRDVERYADRARITVVPPLCPLATTVFNFSQSALLIERAARQTQDWLAAGGLQHTGPLDVPLAHTDHHRAA